MGTSKKLFEIFYYNGKDLKPVSRGTIEPARCYGVKRIIRIFFKALLGVHSPSLRRKIRFKDIFNKSYLG